MNVALGQVPVVWDVAANLDSVRSVLEEVRPDEVVLFPEGMLSGYDDELSGLEDLEASTLDRAVDVVADCGRDRAVHVVCGSLIFHEDRWWNAAIHLAPTGERHVYRKVNLATRERGRLAAGGELPVFPLRSGEETLAVGPQLCREVRFPEQWHALARMGTEAFAYLTNAANTEELSSVWRSHLISRAAETQRFVLSVNAAHPDQHCPTMVISPKGDVIAEAATTEPTVVRASLDLGAVSNWYLDQQRSDVVVVSYEGSNARPS